MATFTNQSKSSSNWSGQSRAGVTFLSQGSPIGLLLALTYSADALNNANTFTSQSRNAATFTNQAKS